MCKSLNITEWKGLCSCVLTAFRNGCVRTVLSSPFQRRCASTFTSSMDFFPDPNILLAKTSIKVVKEATFLGLTFDTKLTFKNHVQCLQSSSQKALDIVHRSSIPPLGIHMLLHLGKSRINLKLIDEASCLDVAPWTLSAPTVRFDLTKFKKDTFLLPFIYIYILFFFYKLFSHDIRLILQLLC